MPWQATFIATPNPYLSTMGKQSQLKKQKIFALSSIEDAANCYLNATKKRAKFIRTNLANQYIEKATISSHFIPFQHVLSALPSYFVDAYINLLGHTIVGVRHKEFWGEIAENLLIITEIQQNKEALIEWGKEATSPELIAKTYCYATLQKLAESLAPLRRALLLKEVQQKGLNNIFHDAIPTHLVASSAIAQGNIIKQSGSLILFFQDTGLPELWLVKKRFDGIYTVSTEARDGSLRASEIRDMRCFINQYNGPFFRGGLCPAREKEAARICSSVGLQTDGKCAWIGDIPQITLP
jgi:hypothetical protein